MDKTHSRGSDIAFPFILAALLLALYWSGFRVFFSLDDLQFLLRAAGIDQNPATQGRLISTKLFFAASWKLFGSHPWPYHLIVFLFHAANAAIVYVLARRLKLEKSAAYAASVLFATTFVAFLPLHWISGIQEVTMTFFALIAAYFFFRQGTASIAISLAAVGCSMLCKESSILLFPALSLVLPVSRKRKWLLGSAGLLLSLGLLALAGTIGIRPAGHPYETSFGVNILWNLLTYSAWLARFWVSYPDRIPRYDPHLAAWGLIPPVLLALAAWRLPKAKGPTAKASMAFVLLLLPVLPLVRHSYFYYLYLPLIPLWLLAGAFLARIPRRCICAGILVLFVILSGWNAKRHQTAEIAAGVLEDPILRYAAVAKNAVFTMRQSAGFMQRDVLIIKPASATDIDLTDGQGAAARGRHPESLVERALLGGKALRLFFPRIQNIYFEDPSQSTPGWQHMTLYLTYDLGMMKFLGQGEGGRIALVEDCLANGPFNLAKREALILLEVYPDDPSLLAALGMIALSQKDAKSLEEIVQKLELIESKGDSSGIARSALSRLRQAKK
jgi:Dolichyl-phosphate-mannose-protein mannosyltransferase